MISVDLTINVFSDFTDEEIAQRMKILGELVINRIKENIRNMDLIGDIGGGALLQGWFSTYKDGQLVIENTQDYMIYLEFGTYDYWTRYGKDNYPQNPHPKKKDIPYELAKLFPKGVQPFAFIRKVLYNEIIMQELANKAFA